MTEKYIPNPHISYVVYDLNGKRLEMRYELGHVNKEYYLCACELIYTTVQNALVQANAKA